MIYTAIRLSVDIIYWVGRTTVDGVYYMINGRQETDREKIENHIKTLETMIIEKSSIEKENNLLLKKIAEKNGITTELMNIDIN